MSNRIGTSDHLSLLSHGWVLFTCLSTCFSLVLEVRVAVPPYMVSISFFMQGDLFVVLSHVNVLIMLLLVCGCFGPSLLFLLLFLLLVYRALHKGVPG